ASSNSSTNSSAINASSNSSTDSSARADFPNNSLNPMYLVSNVAESTNVDDSLNYQTQIQQGLQDAYQNRGNNSSLFANDKRAVSYYNAAYNGARSAMSAYDAATRGKGAGTQDYTYYGNTASKINDDGATHTSSNVTDGTPQQYGSQDDANQGGADNPTDASNSSSKYENILNGKLNSALNTSVKCNSTSNKISIPTIKTDTIVVSRSSYQNDTNYGKTFDNAVNYVLVQYGKQDAETGRWQGVYNASNPSETQDWYLTKNPNSDTTNAYDQAYRGARAAMSQYFSKNNNYLGNESVKMSDTGNSYYDQGFNDVVSQASQGIAYVQNGYQYVAVLTGNTNIISSGNVASKVNTIRLANDIDLTRASNNELDPNVRANTNTLTIDGQNHLMDFHGINYTVNGSISDLYVQNFQTIYGANYFGPFRGGNGSAVHFGNLNYVGSQLLSSYNNDAYFFGNVNVIVPNNRKATYNSPFQSNVQIQGGGNQENLEVKNFILQVGAHYYGTVSPVRGGNNIIASGNVTIDHGAKMTLVPRGGNGEAERNIDGSTFGIYLNGRSASLNVAEDATVNIIPSTYYGRSGMIGGGIYAEAGASITIDGGTINYQGKNGTSGNYNQPIELKGAGTSITVINDGLFQVWLDAVPSSGNQTAAHGLIANSNNGKFQIGSRGNLKVGVTNSDSSSIIPYYGPININSVGENHVIFIKPNGTNKFQTAGNNAINAYTVVINNQGMKQYLYYFNLPSGSSTYTGIDLNGNSVTGTVSGNALDIASVPSVRFMGPLAKKSNADGTTTVTAYAKLSDYQILNGQPIYVGISAGQREPLSQIKGDNVTDSYSAADPFTYTAKVSTDGYDGGIIPITYTISSGVSTNYVGMRLRYGINSVSTVLTPNGTYNTTVEGFNGNGRGKVAPDSNGDMVVVIGDTAIGQQGVIDGITDAMNDNAHEKSSRQFNTQTNKDYISSYNSAQDGYKAYSKSETRGDYTKTSGYRNSNNPAAFIQGYNAALQQAQLAKDALDAEAKKVTAAINSDASLTDSQKADQKQAVADVAQQAKTAVEKAGNALVLQGAKVSGIVV
ncbi:DUF1542 domain-containing protein, partial [Leuconostoc citreum]|uniref:DUF1542 domain-containing protein n=1 Tax=Leuconostoc citreum TaxID=33964 RepID=UPI00200A34EC